VIYRISHELCTPAGLVRGHAELPESGELADLQTDQEELVSVISCHIQMLNKMAAQPSTTAVSGWDCVGQGDHRGARWADHRGELGGARNKVYD
jgi:hypothetical protein